MHISLKKYKGNKKSPLNEEKEKIHRKSVNRQDQNEINSTT